MKVRKDGKKYLKELLRNNAPRQIYCLRREVIKSFHLGYKWINETTVKTNDSQWTVEIRKDEHGLYAQFI